MERRVRVDRLVIAVVFAALAATAQADGGLPRRSFADPDLAQAVDPFLLHATDLISRPEHGKHRYLDAQVITHPRGYADWMLDAFRAFQDSAGNTLPMTGFHKLPGVAQVRHPLVWTAVEEAGQGGGRIAQRVARFGTLRRFEQTRIRTEPSLDGPARTTRTRLSLEYQQFDTVIYRVWVHASEAAAEAAFEAARTAARFSREPGLKRRVVDDVARRSDGGWLARSGVVVARATPTCTLRWRDGRAPVAKATAGWRSSPPDPAHLGSMGVRYEPAERPRVALPRLVDACFERFQKGASTTQLDKLWQRRPRQGPYLQFVPAPVDRELAFALRALEEALATVGVHVKAGNAALAERNLATALQALARAEKRYAALQAAARAQDPPRRFEAILHVRYLPTDVAVREIDDLKRTRRLLVARFRDLAGRSVQAVDQLKDANLAFTRLLFRTIAQQFLGHAVGLPEAYRLPDQMLDWYAESLEAGAALQAGASDLARLKALRDWVAGKMDAAKAEVARIDARLAALAPLDPLHARLERALAASRFARRP